MPRALGSSYLEASLTGLNSAVFSSCKKYRYRLDRIWDDRLPPLAFGMLNPSTADEETNDPTIERCVRRAQALGFGALIVWNLFAFRATNPNLLKSQSDPVGPENDSIIRHTLLESSTRNGTIIVGWGTRGTLLNRHQRIKALAIEMGIRFLCLGTTKSGQPKHPLYVSYGSQPHLWEGG